MSLSYSDFDSTNKVDILKQQLTLEEESNLASFEPPKKPIVQTKADNPVQSDNELKHEKVQQEVNNTYYNQYLPPSIEDNSTLIPDTPKHKHVDMDLLNQKLDYLINLFEEQKEFRTEGILEELILYIFFGIFIIYVIHSFTKIKSYSR